MVCAESRQPCDDVCPRGADVIHVGKSHDALLGCTHCDEDIDEVVLRVVRIKTHAQHAALARRVELRKSGKGRREQRTVFYDPNALIFECDEKSV